MQEKYKSTYKSTFKPVDLPTESTPFIHITCPSCDHEIEASDINIQDKIAKCNSCHAVFPISEQLQNGTEKTEELVKPVGVEKNFFGEELELAIPQPLGVLYTILLMLSPLLIFICFAMYIKTYNLIAAIAGGLFVLLFSYPLISAMRTSKNKVYFNVDKEVLHIEWDPKKFVPIKNIPVNQIEQIYTTRTHNGVALKAILNTSEGQAHKILVDQMKSVTIAKYTEQELEKYLGIPNKKVSNEIE